MDTLLKKLKCSKVTKWIVMIGIYLSTFIIILSGMGMRLMPEPVSYFDSMDFRELFVKKAGYVRDWIVRYDEDKIFYQVTKDQIANYIEYTGKEMTEQEAIDGIIADRKNYYSTIQNELVETNKNLEYFAMDITTGRYLTNMNAGSREEMMKQLTSRSNYLIGNGYYILNLKYGTDHQISYYSDQYTMDMNYYAGEKFEGQDNYRIYVALKEELVPGDDFYVGYKYANSYQAQERVFYNACVIALIVNVILMTYWLILIGRAYDEKGIIPLDWFDRVPLELQGLMVGIVCLIAKIIVGAFARKKGLFYFLMNITMQGTQYKVLGIMIFFAACILPISLIIKWIISLFKHIKGRTMLQHIWGYRLGCDLYHMTNHRLKAVIYIGSIVAINVFVDVVMIFLVQDYFYDSSYGVLVFIPLILWNVICGLIMIKLFVDYKKTLQVAKAITEGELDKKVELDMTIPILNDMAETINSMGTGLEKAVGESIKSERLKTELITNVSHDLKTPLTSIISYIDLLKGENIENETAREYINVLDERSHRLKQLVEDLVEASKAVTGNVKADIQMIRFDELVGQALGEYQDRIEASDLSLVTDRMEEVYALADGRHMWRVIENLLSNVCKYAMPHTRVYVEVYSKEGYGYCTIKNISKESLNIDPQELTERFVRGDASRTTEGSGLGLAIAQSLLLIQEGVLELTIDGDLFKATVQIPLAESMKRTLEQEM